MRVRLVYERLGGAQQCPAAETLVVAVRERLGYSPVDYAAREVIRVSIEGSGKRRLKARIVWLDSAGLMLGQRKLSSGRSDCDSLVADIALAVAVALDPEAVEALRQGKVAVRRARRQRSMTETRAPRRSAPESSLPPPDPPPFTNGVAEPSPQVRWHIGLVVGLMAGKEADPVSPAGGVEVGLTRGLWSGALRLRVSGIGSQPAGEGASYSLVTPEFALRGCVSPSPVEICAQVAGGVSIASGTGPAGSVSSVEPMGAAGLSLGAWLPLDGPFRPFLEVSAEVPFVRARVVADGLTLFRAWPVVLGLAAGLRVLL